jgi:hypothetical protein
LYDGKDNSKLIVKELLCIGKSHYAMGIISGSSAHVKNLVHREGEQQEHLRGYPNLNHSVYTERHLPPVRKREELLDVIQLYSADIRGVDDLFSKTGGVGRFMDAYFKGNFDLSMLPDIIKYLEQDSKLRTILHKLFIKNNGPQQEVEFDVSCLCCR